MFPNIRKEACELLEYGGSKEGYWNSERFLGQMKVATDIAKFKYSRHLYASQNSPSARYAWEDTSANEMMLLRGMIIALGVHSSPEWQDYWSQNPILGLPAIIKGMPLTRFLQGIDEMHPC